MTDLSRLQQALDFLADGDLLNRITRHNAEGNDT